MSAKSTSRQKAKAIKKRVAASAKSKNAKYGVATRVSHVCEALGVIAPPHLAQSWDNVGLLAGDPAKPARQVMLCIDLTPEVAEEAVRRKVELVMAYHPPIFKPITRITAVGAAERSVFRCIEAGIAVYSMHTALDAADGGTNDVIARLCGIPETHPVEYADQPESECKIVVMVPVDEVDAVAEAMFAAGAGHIGDYSKCSYRLDGTGTFLGSDATQPTIGQKGRYETVRETRLEMVCPRRKLPVVISALVRAHSYEEPAFDIYPLLSRPARGIGRTGAFAKPITLSALARKLKRAVGGRCVSLVGDGAAELRSAVIVVGAAGSLPFQLPLTSHDVIITGEMRHHDALTALRRNLSAITLSHWTSERPALASVAERLTELLPRIRVLLSESDRDPFAAI